MRKHNYQCSKCDRELDRSDMAVVKVQFKELGSRGSILRSRNTEYLCKVPQPDGSLSCLHSHPIYKMPAYAEAPGMADTVLRKELR